MSNPKRAADQYRSANIEAAKVILGNVAKYGGEDAALVEWARTVLAKAEPGIRGPLLKGAA